MAKLKISDPETGEHVGTLVIPPGATHEQIIEAGKAVLARHRAKKANGHAAQDAPPAAGQRELLCQLCRQPIPESDLAAHVEVEQQRMMKLELADEARRGRR